MSNQMSESRVPTYNELSIISEGRSSNHDYLKSDNIPSSWKLKKGVRIDPINPRLLKFSEVTEKSNYQRLIVDFYDDSSINDWLEDIQIEVRLSELTESRIFHPDRNHVSGTSIEGLELPVDTNHQSVYIKGLIVSVLPFDGKESRVPKSMYVYSPYFPPGRGFSLERIPPYSGSNNKRWRFNIPSQTDIDPLGSSDGKFIIKINSLRN